MSQIVTVAASYAFFWSISGALIVYLLAARSTTQRARRGII